MIVTKELIERLRDTHSLDAEGFKAILLDDSPESCAFLRAEARKAADAVFGRGVFIRGLIEISNHCRNNCYYCGLRAGNAAVRRYRLSTEEVLECCRRCYRQGFRTFVLQGGEDPVQTDDWVENLVKTIRAEFPDCAITLSLGEKSYESYRRFREAGVDRYLLRHETFDPEHYSRLHPSGMSREKRLECLRNLKELGYQTGSGIMVGSPYQTVDNLVEDLLFIRDLRPEMIGIGPFIHHRDTPFSSFDDGSVALTLKLISIFRLMDPHALIPSTTALVTLDSEARSGGILAGANVVMPNCSPASVRGDYAIYEGKAASGTESAEGLDDLRKELDAIGCEIVTGRGDYDKFL